MNHKKKKFTISKIVLFIPYLITCFLLYIVWYVITKELGYTYVTPIVTAFVASLGVCGYVTKWYLKKSALENEPKIRLGVMEDLYNFQKEHPDFNIYDKVQMRQDAMDITKPIKMDEQRTYEKVITDDMDTKIN